MPRKDITSFNVSGNLKTALENAGFENETRPGLHRNRQQAGRRDGESTSRILAGQRATITTGIMPQRRDITAKKRK